MSVYLKRVDKAIRSGYALAVSSFFRRSVAAGYYKISNFGDLLTPDLLSYFGLHPIHCPRIARSDVIGAGSVLHMMPPSYKGCIIGSGLISREQAKTFNDANIMLVRGRLTKKCCSMSDDVSIGDPGLIADKVYQEITQDAKEWDVGFIPHYCDLQDNYVPGFVDSSSHNIHLIDVRRSPQEVICDISKCRIVVSSSLHGLIVAESLRIPNVWVEISGKIIGGRFKFDDYYSCFSTKRDPLILKNISDIYNAAEQSVLLPDDSVDDIKESIISEYEKYTLAILSV